MLQICAAFFFFRFMFLCCVCFPIVDNRRSECFSSPKLYLIKKMIGEGPLKYKLAFSCLIFTLCLLSVSNFAHGQGTDLATIRGTVTDSSGAVVPKAVVSIVDLETNTSRQTATNAQGEYE